MRALEARPSPLGRVGELRRPGPQRVFAHRRPRLCCGCRKLALSVLDQSPSGCQDDGHGAVAESLRKTDEEWRPWAQRIMKAVALVPLFVGVAVLPLCGPAHARRQAQILEPPPADLQTRVAETIGGARQRLINMWRGEEVASEAGRTPTSSMRYVLKQSPTSGKGFVVAPASIEDTMLPTAAKLAALLGGTMIMVLAWQRMRPGAYPAGDAREDPAEAYSRAWADQVKREETALTQRSVELRRHLSSGVGSGAAAMAGAGFSGVGSGSRSPPSGSRSPPSGAATKLAAGSQAFLPKRSAPSGNGGRDTGGTGSRGQTDSSGSSSSGAAETGGASGSAAAAPAAVVARGGNPLAQTSNEAATALPSRTAVLQRPPPGTTEGDSHGGGHRAPPALPSKPAAPQLPASSSANGGKSPVAALPSPTKDVAALLPPAPPPPAPPVAQPAVPPQHGTANGNDGGVRGWINGLRGYRSYGMETDLVPAAPLDSTPAPVRNGADSTGQVTPLAGSAIRGSAFDGNSATTPMVVALGVASALADLLRQATASNGVAPGRTVLMQRQGNSVVAGWGPAPAYRPPKPSLPKAPKEPRVRTGTPLTGLVTAAVPRAPSKWDKYDLLHDALKTSADSQPANAKYNPVRTLLDAAPARGVSRNDFLGSLLHGMIHTDAHAPGASKYDVVWDLLHAGRSNGATAAPKYDPIYEILNSVNVWSSWGNSDDEWNTSLRYDPVAHLFAATTTAPTVRSKYDVLQAFFSLEAPTHSKYDAWRAVVDSALSVKGLPQKDPAAAFMRAINGFVDIGTKGESKWDPVSQGFESAPEPLGKSQPRQEDAAVTARQPTLRAARQQSKYDPVPFLLEAVARALERPPSQYSKYDVLQALLSAALDPPPEPHPTGIGAIAAALRRALRLPGSFDDADAALPPRRRRRVPPVRPQFPVKAKRVVAASPRRAKKRATVTARKPWRLPRFWEPQQTTSATGGALGQGQAVPVTTPFQAQAPVPAAEQAQQSAAGATDGGAAASRPLDAQLDAGKQGTGSIATRKRSPWWGAAKSKQGTGSAATRTRSPWWGAAKATGATGVAAKRSSALPNAAVVADDATASALDVKPAGAVSAKPVVEVSTTSVPAQAAGEESAAAHESGVASLEDADVPGAAGAAAPLRSQPATPAAASHDQQLPPLHQLKRPLPRVWLSGRDPWGARMQMNGLQGPRTQPANGAVAPPTARQMPAEGQSTAPELMRLYGARELPKYGMSNGADKGASNDTSHRVSSGASATGSHGDHGSAGDARSRHAGTTGAVGTGQATRKATISANAAAALLDARPPVLSQRTAPRPAPSSNGLSPGAGRAVRRAPVPVSSAFSVSVEPLHNATSTPSAEKSADAHIDPAAATDKGASVPAKPAHFGPHINNPDMHGALAPPEDSARSAAEETRAPAAGHELRRASSGRPQQPARGRMTAANNVVERRALRLGSPVR